MSNSLREQAAWRSGKVPIISKYAEEHAALMSAIAGRGFLNLPGYAYSAENRLEFATKYSLSELNFKILSETVERELKQAGIDYDLAYKDAALAWEIQKQALMEAWEAELALIKQGMAEEEEVLNALAVEVSKRAITLMEAKVLIEEQMEAYRKTLAELDGTVSPYEVQLANARLLTAQKKAEVLPYIEAILVKEQELIVLQQEKAGELTTYMDAVKEISDKKELLKPYLLNYANKAEALAAKIVSDQIPKEMQIAGEKVSQAEAAVEKSGYQIQEIAAGIETEEKRLDLAEGKRDLGDTRFDYEQSIVVHEKSLTNTYQNDVKADHAVGIANERAATAEIISDKTTINATKNATKLTSVNTVINAERGANDLEVASNKSETEQVATIKAAAKLTASLEHIIG
jgi:hypothetical protein